jgi:hypothetical protein
MIINEVSRKWFDLSRKYQESTMSRFLLIPIVGESVLLLIPLISPSKCLAIKKAPGVKPGANLKLGGDGGGLGSTYPHI